MNLSVCSPALDGRTRPVMVFFHGGGFGSGSGLMSWYGGVRLADEGGVVVVSASYRLGPFGYLVLDGVSQGNLGVLDQIAALQWVQRNIDRFGGDPGNVTVFGQSAGGMSIDLLLGIPPARALFGRAIIQSAPIGLSDRIRDDALIDGAAFVEHLGQDPRDADAAALLAAFRATAVDHRDRVGNAMDPPFAPVRGVGVVPERADELADVNDLDLLVGWNRDEMSAFDDSQDAAAATRRTFAEPWIDRSRQLQAAGAHVAGYRLDWRPTCSPFGATHCVELPLLLGDEQAWRASPMLGTVPWSTVDSLGRSVRAVWARFAHTGEVHADLSRDTPIRWAESAEAFTDLQ